MHHLVTTLTFLVVLLSWTESLSAASIVITFETLYDGDAVAEQFGGLTFTNTVALSAGISLNEFEFPPHSGSTLVSDNNGPLSVTFAQPVLSVLGYFTYSEPLTLTAFDGLGTEIGVVHSAFSSNLALSGDAGSSANELLGIASSLGIGKVTVSGNALGGYSSEQRHT